MRTYYIYEIKNNVTREKYVGSTVDPRARKLKHFASLRRGDHKNHKLQNAWDNHEESDFEWNLLEEIEGEYEDSLKAEQRYMDEFKHKHGIYNVLPYAGKAKERSYRKETLEKMSETARGRIISEEQKERLRKLNLGRKIPDEAIEKMKKSQRDRAEGMERWPHAKFAEDQIKEYLLRIFTGENVKDIYLDYGMSLSSAYRIARGDAWAYLYDRIKKESA